MDQSITNNPDNREIRIFISSTFRDMKQERDLLVKEVFPALRRICAKRFVTFTEVDLRWGITEEQSAKGEVLPYCLAEIERCRPYFIGLLGERYGSLADVIPADVIEKEPWLKGHLHGRTSVTELEILHGVLNAPEMQDNSFFYLRKPDWIKTLPEAEQRDMVEQDIPAEIEEYGAEEAVRRTNERKGQLAALKQRIRDSKTHTVEEYENPKVLVPLIEKQFNALIDQLYPEASVPDALGRERMAHESHARNKLFACIDRPHHLAALNAFVEATEHKVRGIVVTSESGGGKSALLAAWARDHAKTRPDEFLFQHYFGATPDSSSPDGFLRRLLGELKARFQMTEEIPTQPDKLREALPLWLAQAANKGRVILVLDGLNHVQGDEPDRRLNFLRHVPPNVVVIASSLPGTSLDALHDRDWTVHDLPLANEEEVDTMIGAYLGVHGRDLDAALRRQLVIAPGSRNPLFLRTVLEELRQIGSFKDLPEQVRQYLEADNPKELFLRVIRRWQTDFDADIDLIRRSLTHLWATREGLSESEWLDLLGDHASPLPRIFWTPFFFALEPHLSQRAELFAFGHDFIRQAVETMFLSSPTEQKLVHLALASYFEGHPNQLEMTPRKASEWPYQLYKAEEWDRLEKCLTDIHLFHAISNDKTLWELTGYWHPLRARGKDMGVCYIDAYRKWSDWLDNDVDYYVSAQLGTFLMFNGVYSAAENLLRTALENLQSAMGSEHPYTLKIVNQLAVCLERNGDYSEAQTFHELALETYKRVLGKEHSETLASMNNLGLLLMHRGDLEKAQPFLELAVETSEQMLGCNHYSTFTSMHNLAELLRCRGDYKHALSLYKRALETCEQMLGSDHPDTLTTVNDLSGLLMDTGDYAGAKSLLERALEGRERVMGPEHPDTLITINGLALLLNKNGDYAGALTLQKRALEIQERILGPEHPNTLTSMSNLAALLQSSGDFKSAMPLYEHALEACERRLGSDHPGTLTKLNNLGELLSLKGDYEKAQLLLERVLKSRERVLGAEHPDTVRSVMHLATLLASVGDNSGAYALYDRALGAGSRVLGPTHPDTLKNINNLAVLLINNGNYSRAQQLFEQITETYEKVLGSEHPDTIKSINNLAGLLERKGDYSEAMMLYERAQDISERVLGIEHPETLMIIYNFACLLGSKGNYKRSLLLFERVITGAYNQSRIIDQLHPHWQLFIENFIVFLKNNGHSQEQISAILQNLAPDLFQIEKKTQYAFNSFPTYCYADNY